MKTVLASLLAISLLPGEAFPQSSSSSGNATTRSFVRAREVLLAAAEAAGGLERLRAVKTVHRVGKGKTYTQGQGLRPDSPPIVRDIETDAWVDFAGNRARGDTRTKVAGVAIHNRNVLVGETGYAWNAATNASTRFTPVQGANLRNNLRRDPLRVIVSALSRAETARSLGTDTFDGRPHDVVAFSEPDGTLLTLYLDSETHLPSKLETWSDAQVLGDTLNEQVFSDYRTVGGLKAPFRLTVRNAGQVTQELAYSTIEVDASPDAKAFDLPADLLEPSPMATTSLVVKTLAPGVHYLTGGTHYSLAVEFPDHVVIVEAPLTSERSKAVLAKVRELVPGKPVRSVVNTHYHFDHSGGLREYISEGITVVTHPVNADFVKGLASRPRAIRPDRLSAKPAEAKVQTVADKLVISGGDQTLELYALPNSHVDGMLIAYLPKSKVLYSADLFGPPLVGPLPSGNDFGAELRDGIRKRNLQVEILAGAHGRETTVADLDQSIAMRKK